MKSSGPIETTILSTGISHQLFTFLFFELPILMLIILALLVNWGAIKKANKVAVFLSIIACGSLTIYLPYLTEIVAQFDYPREGRITTVLLPVSIFLNHGLFAFVFFFLSMLFFAVTRCLETIGTIQEDNKFFRFLNVIGTITVIIFFLYILSPHHLRQ